MHRSIALPGVAALLVGIALGCGGGDRRIQVIYYYQSGSEASERQRPGLQALEGEFTQRVAVRLIDASLPEAKRDLARLAFPTHGLVVRDYRGVMLFKQSGDDFDLDEIRAILRQGAGAG